MKFEWSYGENGNQKYYEATNERDYLCVFENKWNPNVWLGMYQKHSDGRSVSILNKTKNDRVRKKQGLPIGCDVFDLTSIHLLASDNPEYMMKKVEWCYTHNLLEISQ